MKIVILGGTGFIGTHLSQYLIEQGHQVCAYGRAAFENGFDLPAALNGADVLVLLSGENIGQRWNDQYKQALYDSRVLTSRRVKAAIEQCEKPPKSILAASAIGIYPQRDCQHAVDEFVTEIGDNFLAELGQAWEAENLRLTPKPVVMRFGVVLGEGGGALAKMLLPFKLGLGGPVAGGQQCFSWIHIDDLVRAITFLLERPELQGVFNLTSPNPLSNDDFGRALARTLHRPYLIPLPYWQLRLMFGEGAQVLTHSAAVLPKRLLDAGFNFDFPMIESALKQILSK